MIINTNYRLGSFVDLCHCPCNNPCGNWQTSCPCNNPCLSPCHDFCPPQCPPPCPSPCQNSCDFFNISIPKNAAFFMAGYLLSRGIYKD